MSDKKINTAEALKAYFSTAPSYCEPYGNGHINDTFLVVADKRYIMQRMNTRIFTRPAELMETILGVTEHIRRKAAAMGRGDVERASLVVVPTLDGKQYFVGSEGDHWRLYEFTEGTVTQEVVENKQDFYNCAVAFGQFQRMLADYPAEKLHETIVNFHNTPWRYENLMRAVEADSQGRLSEVTAEVEFAKARKDFAATLENARANGTLPLRVTHNDTKLNNILFDAETHEPVCVIDLDTIMPGFSVNDFGDSIRFGASTAAEDEKDLSKVHFDISLFDAYAEGFLKGCGGLLGESEIMLLPEGSKMMTVECGMRFLTDYLSGDTYFRTAYPEHNLDRCRTQFKLVEEMEEQWDDMKAIVKKYI